MRSKIEEIHIRLNDGSITISKATDDVMNLIDWKYVEDETPPLNIEVLAKSPFGLIYLACWRDTYGIFSCQNKCDNCVSWQWKLI
jgi:hypothetical protein